MSDGNHTEQILYSCFGYKKFRPQQKDIIDHIIAGRDTLILMPTGAGKSICYQLPALLKPGLTVIISPLISLMFDQVQDLQGRSVVAYRYHGNSDIPLSRIMDEVRNGTCNILYTTPETLTTNSQFLMELEALYKENMLQRFVVDEAHCVSNWGHDFRPSYLGLHVKSWFSGIQICAFTATATKLVTHDIINNLDLDNPYLVQTSFIKSNISYRIRQKENDSWTYIGNSVAKAVRELDGRRQSGIIYCLSRKECEYISNVLQLKGIAAEYYHALIPQTEKDRIQTEWLSGTIKVIVATIAFALGINKPDVRYIIHTSMPKSIESYYQQTGRAGRDGKLAQCIMYYSDKDVDILKKMATDDSTDRYLVPPVRNTDRIDDMYHLCQNTNDCLKLQMCNYLGEFMVRQYCQGEEYKCHNCLNRTQMRTDKKDNANRLLDELDGQSLSDAKRKLSFKERRLLLHLLNNGNMITEIEPQIDNLKAIERLSKVIEVDHLVI